MVNYIAWRHGSGHRGDQIALVRQAVTLERCFFVACVTVFGAIGAWLGLMFVDNQLPYDYDLPASYISPDPARMNALITVHWKLHKVHRLCPGSTIRSFYDADQRDEAGHYKLITTYDATPAALGVRLGDTELARTFMLRGDMPPNVIYHSKTFFRCNVLQNLWPLEGPDLTVRFRVAQ